VILLFGAGGQLGQELVALAAARREALTGLSSAQADIADREAVAQAMAAARPSLVVNAAAYTHVDRAECEPDRAWRSNAEGATVLAQACREAALPLVHLSTDYVFDGTKAGAYVETDPVRPLGVYGRTKAEGEDGVREQQPEHLILRTSWVYGPYGRNILKTVVRLAAEEDELRFVGDQRGCPTATADLAEAILRIAPRLERREPLWGTYHLAGTGATTWHGFARHVVAAQAAATGRHPTVHAISTAERPTAAARPVNSELDSGLFARTFGFRAAPWREGVERAVRRLPATAAEVA
jgi:dTDP-4-dehydrorhamnose reductase